MTVGFVMLVHTALDRAAEVARHWADQGSPVVIHVDRRVPREDYRRFVEGLADLPELRFSSRYRCEWGTWSLVQATLTATELALAEFPELTHVCLASGSCLPLRPVADLEAYLDLYPDTDFIESVTTEEVPWIVGGLAEERFTLRFPFAWKRQRRLFDRYVALQRRLGIRRRMPSGLTPHMGSQWWCLTRETLSAILSAPDRRRIGRFFRRVWIPDESYFQTLARRHSVQIESRSLTLSKFDHKGRPHLFYDDHLELLRRSNCFIARKIWPRADQLYRTFLAQEPHNPSRAEPNPARIERHFSAAVSRRTQGRAGLYMQSRFPRGGFENGKTAAPYSVFEGFSALFEDFETWLDRATGARVHGHLYHTDGAQFAGGEAEFNGCLSRTAVLRDYNPCGFLTNLIWSSRGERQCFQFGPGDNQEITWLIATDPNAQISVISGAWAIPLFQTWEDFGELRRYAAWLQQVEAAHLDILRSPHTRARVRIWALADFVQNPIEPLQTLIDEIEPRALHRLTEVPKMVDLTGFGRFLQTLKNEGMKPHLMGDFPATDIPPPVRAAASRPYLVR